MNTRPLTLCKEFETIPKQITGFISVVKEETLMSIQEKRFCVMLFAFFILLPYSAFSGTLIERNTMKAPDGRLRYFHYYVPDRLQSKPAVVVLLHGGSQDYSQILKQDSAQSEWLKISDEKGFLLIIPNGVDPGTGSASGSNQHWNDCRADADDVETGADDVGFVNKLIDWALLKYRIDPSRVYATGASNGGMMSYRLVDELSHRIAAVAAFVANRPQNSECTAPRNPTSIFICNGTKDTWMPWNGGQVIKGGAVISAQATRDFWIEHNSAVLSQTKKYRDLDSTDSSTVKSETYSSGLEGSEVMFYTVTGGGHTIPGIAHTLNPVVELIVGPQNHDIEGARQAWNFLSRQTLGSVNFRMDL